MPAQQLPDYALAKPRAAGEALVADDTTYLVSQPIMEIEANPDWSQRARYVWRAYWHSGMAAASQSTDAAVLWSLCETITKADNLTKPSAMMETLIAAQMNDLAMTHSARRKAKIIVVDPPPITPEVPEWMELEGSGNE